MTDKKKIEQAISAAVDDFNDQWAGEQKLSKAMETKLFGQDGSLDSMGLVNFIVAVEQQIEEIFDFTIALADEKAMSQKRSPFRSLQSLSDYVMELLKENGNEQ